MVGSSPNVSLSNGLVSKVNILGGAIARAERDCKYNASDVQFVQ